MKKVYMKPTMKAVMVQHQASILNGSPNAHDVVSNKASYSRQGDWGDEE